MLHPTKEENGEIKDVSCGDAVLHFLAIAWKVLFAIACPPPYMGGGYPCLFLGITCIGFVTYVVAEIAGVFGCVVGLKDGVTAITFVAIGTSLPDTFASMTAAKGSRYADEAVGNITGSNCVNVFLGLGLPWMIATIWKLSSEQCAESADLSPVEIAKACNYKVPAEGLGLSVVLFLGCSLCGFLLLILRRVFVKGELGGTAGLRYASAFAFILLWVIYVIVSALATYGFFDNLSAEELAAQAAAAANAARNSIQNVGPN